MPKTTLELLPSWAECEASIRQMGPQSTPALMRFIHDYENQGPDDEAFRIALAALIDEISGMAINKYYQGSNKK